MGNEFGHPEWVDFPREGNHWSYHHARRQWTLRDDPGLFFHALGDFDRELVSLLLSRRVLQGSLPGWVTRHNDDKFLAFERSGLFFLFNFSPARSLTDYAVETPQGDYDRILDTDEARFGGQGRIAPCQRFRALAIPSHGTPRSGIRVYLPARTAMVLQRVPPAASS
jgi:1,4-alpha-glucan branching enzyme